MKQAITRMAALACVTMVLSACSSVTANLWPFGGSQEQDLSRPPPGATAYTCDGGKRLFVRYIDNGAAAWVILPEREFRLNKATPGAGTHYSNGSATLDIKDNEITLFDGPKTTHAGCKATGG
jgi:membrane-bound inhibitor of C-type lysozyme